MRAKFKVAADPTTRARGAHGRVARWPSTPRPEAALEGKLLLSREIRFSLNQRGPKYCLAWGMSGVLREASIICRATLRRHEAVGRGPSQRQSWASNRARALAKALPGHGQSRVHVRQGRAHSGQPRRAPPCPQISMLAHRRIPLPNHINDRKCNAASRCESPNIEIRGSGVTQTRTRAACARKSIPC